MDNLIDLIDVNSYEMRKGKTVNMTELLEQFDHEFEIDLTASISANDSYEAVSNETFNDLLKVKAKLYLLFELDYLTHTEYEAIAGVAEEMRLKKLEELKNERNS